MRGQIMKGIAGFYYVKSGETVYRCKPRGIFRQQEIKPAVGDLVEFEIIEGNDDSLITDILPRKNSFIRPFIANVDCFAVVTSVSRPAPVQLVLDKMLVMAEMADADIVLCINKCDLAENQKKAAGRKAAANLQFLKEVYEPIYPVILLDHTKDQGYDRLKELIHGRRTALAGASGVGKSTIINRLLQEEQMETGHVSEKSQRGRHTTRHAQLFPLDEEGTCLFDTPGFTSFSLPEMEPEHLQHLFPEIRPWLGRCRYDDCRHIAEPECAVRKAVEEGKIGSVRYESYQSMLKELEQIRKY